MQRLFSIGVLLMTGLAAQPAAYDTRPTEGSRIALTVEKTGLMSGKKHLFLFEKYQGTLRYDPQLPEASQVQFTIDARSATCKDDWVSAKDLRKIMETALEDMLAVKRYPSITFASTSIKTLDTSRFEVQGMLTIRDIAKPVTVTVQLDSKNPARLRLEGTARIRLTDYGLKPPTAVLGAIGTKNEMSLVFQITATRP